MEREDEHEGRGARTASSTPTFDERAEGDDSTPLLAPNDASEFERRWEDLQVAFVDEPERCLKQADELVGEVMDRISEEFARERRNLEAQWSGGAKTPTDDLRVALQRYRTFFHRLLKTS